MAESKSDNAPDLTRGISLADLEKAGKLVGKVGDAEVLVVKQGQECFAIGAHCTHYKGPLVDGLVVGDTVRCPWHHACFSLRTGERLRPPALDPEPRWRVEQTDGRIVVREKLPGFEPRKPRPNEQQSWPESVVIVGGGAAGFVAAQVLRDEGYGRPITMLSADDFPPPDRPNLSKDYLAGTAQEDWIPLQSDDYYRDNRIDLALNARVSALDVKGKRVRLDDGREYSYGALLLATGAEPVHLNTPGFDQPHVYYLRTFDDSKKIVAATTSAKRAMVVGSSFIGLEVAASLRTRGLEVHVVAPEKIPMQRVMGPEMGRFIQGLHESHGVVFHLGQTVSRLDGHVATLSDQSTLTADIVVVGVGVKPRLELAQQADLKIDRGVLVSEYLETSAPGVFAAGDIARWPDPHSSAHIRVEHWVVAERQGQAAARNMLGRRERFDAVPFFWSQHYDIQINYVGHAESWDGIDVNGTFDEHDCAVTYRRGSRVLAVATIFRDLESLQAEYKMEQGVMELPRTGTS
jgi:NADPH-dependent 2,4-dienoyl-CoA reductase/sulfur reductase-like enzyme/nitrite reductase/ring-hydroxylating ferredoxin subunit